MQRPQMSNPNFIPAFGGWVTPLYSAPTTSPTTAPTSAPPTAALTTAPTSSSIPPATPSSCKWTSASGPFLQTTAPTASSPPSASPSSSTWTSDSGPWFLPDHGGRPRLPTPIAAQTSTPIAAATSRPSEHTYSWCRVRNCIVARQPHWPYTMPANWARTTVDALVAEASLRVRCQSCSRSSSHSR